MFDIRIEEINYYYNLKCDGEFREVPKVKAEILIRDENNFISLVMKRTWIFDVLSYNTDPGVGAIESIIEEIVKKLWTELHEPIPKEKNVRIDMYLPLHANNAERSYMNNLFTKYLVNERARDKYYRLQSNSRFGLGIEPEVYIRDIINHNRRYDNHILYARIAKDREKTKEKFKEYEKMKIENVIFNDPATIVFWRDGSKTVVKAKDEPYDPEKGLAMAIAKKAYGNEGNYYNEFKKFIKDEPKKLLTKDELIDTLSSFAEEESEEKNE